MPRLSIPVVVFVFVLATAATLSGFAGLSFFGDDKSQTAATNGIIGNSLPGVWRPFADDSLWNSPIPTDAKTHPDSSAIMGLLHSEADHLRIARRYIVPIWVVDADAIPKQRVRSDLIYDEWDRDRDGWSDVGVPLQREMWAEPTADGHIIVLDPRQHTSWEMSRFEWMADGTPRATTFNIWDLRGSGAGSPDAPGRWQTRGGRGSGFPLIAGLLRPEEIAAGEVRHALVFTNRKNRRADNGQDIFVPPASRSDGRCPGNQFPIEGMRFQLDPTLTERDFDSWGLSKEAKIVARALQRYGMYLGDNGGPMAIQLQLLRRDPVTSQSEWERMFPRLFHSIEKIPTNRLRVVQTGPPVQKGKPRSISQDQLQQKCTS